MELIIITVIVKNVTGSQENEWLLHELNRAGVKLGTKIEGHFNPLSGSVQFESRCNNCVAWLGETCEEIA